MGWYLTVARLKTILNKCDDEAIVMIANTDDSPLIYDASDEISHMYRDEEGEVFGDDEIEDDESTARLKKAVVLWPASR